MADFSATDDSLPVKKQKIEGDDSSAPDQPVTRAAQIFDDQPESSAGRASEQKEVAQVFGDTQGPAGSAIAEGLSASEAGTGLSEEQPSELEPGIVTIEDRSLPEDQEGADAALRTADKARMRGSTDDAVLDALEAAETAYDCSRSAAEPAGTMNQRLSSRLEGAEGSGSPALGSGRTGGKKGVHVDEGVRQKICLKFVGCMQRNAALASLSPVELERHAAELEAACQSSSSSRPVYTSKAGNMARLLCKCAAAEDLSELPRIASGLQKEVAEGKVSESVPVRTDTTGLQGIVSK